MAEEEKYRKLPRLEETEFGRRLENIKKLQEEYNSVVDYRNQLSSVLKKVSEYNQFDRQIIDFQKSVSSTELSDGVWKLAIISGLNVIMKDLDKKIVEVDLQLSQIISP